MDNYYVSKLLPLIAEAGVAAIPNPLINITLQGRHDTFPKRRGLTRVKEMRAHGITVGWGQDCVLDPWYSLGTADMLDVAFMGLHVAQMTSPDDMRACFAMVTEENARILNLEGYGLRPGARASLVVLDAADPVEALRRGAAARGDRPRPGRRRVPRRREPPRASRAARHRDTAAWAGRGREPVSVWRIDGPGQGARLATGRGAGDEERQSMTRAGTDGRFLAGGGEVGAIVAAREWSARPSARWNSGRPSCAAPSRWCSAPRCRW